MVSPDRSDKIRLQIAARNRPAEPTLDLIIPVYNEEETIPHFMERIDSIGELLKPAKVRCLFVNDGSRDATLDVLWGYVQSREDIAVVDLSRNFGKEAALCAGLEASTADIAVPIDVDLQDPPELIADFLEKWREGYSVVAGRRIDRQSDTPLKRFTSGAFYRVFNTISDTPIIDNVGDFRLMDRKVVDALNQMPESTRFMKGLFGWVGFPTAVVDYTRPKRVSGQTTFSYRKLFRFAMDGLMSFSGVPLRMWLYLGILAAGLSASAGVFIFLRTLVFGRDVPGFATLFVSIAFAFSIQMVSLGVLAEYVSRIFVESKRRPTFLVNTSFGAGVDEDKAA